MAEINAVIEWQDGTDIQFEDYYEGLKAYDQITNSPGFVGPVSFCDLREP
jgi:hypothetical protein